jgi:hypothetical protein
MNHRFRNRDVLEGIVQFMESVALNGAAILFALCLLLGFGRL